MTPELDYTFQAMGSEVRLVIGRPLDPRAPAQLAAADREREFVLDFARRLSRFIPDSELCQLNRAPDRSVPASSLLRAAIGAAVWAAERSGGLVDSSLVQALERTGYAHSLQGATPASLREALIAAPPRQPARPRPGARWRGVVVDAQTGTISRPPGMMFDTGGIGKGLCADAVALRLRGYTRYVVDCGGDIAVGGLGAEFEPHEIAIEHPLTASVIGMVQLTRGGIATSGLNVRVWRNADGTFAHHLLDPSTGRPAWTGLVGATAIGDSALEAETLSKMALLMGASGARDILAAHGGLIVHDDGEAEIVGRMHDLLEQPTTGLAAA